MRYYRLASDGECRLVARAGDDTYDLSSVRPELTSFTDLAKVAAVAGTDIDALAGRLVDAAESVDITVISDEATVPVVASEVWAAGVTYEISSEARKEESSQADVYSDVYESERPELFFKATPSRTVGPGDEIGIRGDSAWNVPEPELGVVLYRGEVVGYTVGNDVSSRDIEGENPLYLPQAKVYDRCCALGPCVASAETVGDPHDLPISMTIRRDGDSVFDEETSTEKMVRTCEELVSYLTRHNTLPEIAVLLTGTTLVPPEEFTLQAGDDVSIEIDGIGSLENVVMTV